VTAFVHIHVHSDYSFLESACRVRDLAARAAKYDMPALALTDHGNLSGAVEFFRACRQEGVKPIIGMEACVDGHRLTLLAETQDGYRNLVALASVAGLGDGNIPLRELAKYAGGLIMLSDCERGEAASLLLEGKRDEARNAAQRYRVVFGRDNFYLEVGASGTPRQDGLNASLADVAREARVRLVAGCNVHYLVPEDAITREALRVLKGERAPGPIEVAPYAPQLHFMSSEEASRFLGDYPEAVARTLEIAGRCKVEMDFGARHAPAFPVPEGFESERGLYLNWLGVRGMKARYGETPPTEATARFVREYRTVVRLGCVDEYLVAHQVVHAARQKGIPVGPGRGASAGSILSYALGITDVDPLRYGLRFERFLNENRAVPPDFDIDFCARGRRKMARHLLSRLGPERAVRAASFRRRYARQAVLDAGRALGMSHEKVRSLALRIPRQRWTCIARAIDCDKELRSFYESDDEVRSLLDLARGLEDLVYVRRAHRAAVVLGDAAMKVLVPVHRPREGGPVTTQFDTRACETLGFVKQDLMSRRELTKICDTCRCLSERTGENVDPREFPPDESRVYEMLSRGDTRGLFELKSPGMAELLTMIAPDRFEHLVAAVALYRPGPLGCGMVDEYVARRHGRAEALPFSPLATEILAETYGVLLYQEQVMDIALRVAGIPLADGDEMRRAMGKKIPEQMKSWRMRFIEGVVAKGADAQPAKRLFDHVEYFSGYGFNKAHAVCRALVAYWSGYLKACFGVTM